MVNEEVVFFFFCVSLLFFFSYCNLKCFFFLCSGFFCLLSFLKYIFCCVYLYRQHIDRGALNGFIVYKQFDYLEKAFRLQSKRSMMILIEVVCYGYYERMDIERILYRNLILLTLCVYGGERRAVGMNNSCWCCRKLL